MPRQAVPLAALAAREHQRIADRAVAAGYVTEADAGGASGEGGFEHDNGDDHDAEG